MFPQYKFRDLPPDHLLFTSNFAAREGTPLVRGLSNGVRELVLTGIAEAPRVERSRDATHLTAPHIKLTVANGTVSTTGNQTTVLLGKTE